VLQVAYLIIIVGLCFVLRLVGILVIAIIVIVLDVL